MSSYWKQSLWIGGIYWIISQVFTAAESFNADLIDAGLSVLLLLFLIPMNWLQPVRRIDEVIRKAPIVSTLLVAVGWVPYAVAVIFLANVAVAVAIVMAGPAYDYQLFTLLKVVIVATNLRHLATILTVFMAVFMILVRHKSIAGCLDKHYRLTASDACDAVTVEPAAAASAKSMYACKEAVKERKGGKKAVKKSASAKLERAGKSDASQKVAKVQKKAETVLKEAETSKETAKKTAKVQKMAAVKNKTTIRKKAAKPASKNAAKMEK